MMFDWNKKDIVLTAPSDEEVLQNTYQTWRPATTTNLTTVKGMNQTIYAYLLNKFPLLAGNNPAEFTPPQIQDQPVVS